MTLRISLVTEGDPDQVSGGFLYQRRVADLAPAHGAEIRFVSIPHRRYPLGVVDGRAVLRDAADADVMVVDSLASNTLGPWLARGAPRPLVGSVHQVLGGTEGSRLGRRVRRVADRLAWRRCERVLVPSELLAGQLRADGLTGPDIVVVPPGRDIPERPETSAAVPSSADRRVELRQGRRAAVLCVANWIVRKGVAETLDAVAGLPDDLVTLHLVGDEHLGGSYRDAVLARLARPELRDRVVRHGTLAPAAVAELYDAADVFVLASSEEPYGMVYAEAMVAGVPVVGWRAGNLPNLVDDGTHGRLAELGDVAALGAAIGELAVDEVLRARLGEAARRRAATFPTWHETAGRFVDVCRSVR